MAAAAAGDDFTFPTAAASSSTSSGFDSPPLWRRSPAASPLRSTFSSSDHHRRANSGGTGAGPSQALVQDLRIERCPTILDRGEERMDMLWEDLNDELPMVDGSKRPRVVYPVAAHGGLVSPKRRAWGAVSDASQARMMRRSSSSCSGMMIVKVLKTVFLFPGGHHHSGGGFRPPAPVYVKNKTNRSYF